MCLIHRIGLLAISVVLSAGSIVAQAGPPSFQLAQAAVSVELPSEWQVGTTYKIEVVKERERYRDGQLQLRGGSSRVVSLEILQRTDAGYVMAWINGPTQLPEAT